MTDTTENQELSELDKLKETATEMGIEFHPNIGVDKLKERIDAAFGGVTQTVVEEEPVNEIPAPSQLAGTSNEGVITQEMLNRAVEDAKAGVRAEHVAAAAAVPSAPETESQRRYRLKKEATQLVRVHVLNMNPFRKDWESDTYCVGNRSIGTIKRVVPFNTDWHVERALLNVMQERTCTIYTSRKNPVTGQEDKTQRIIKELQIAILPPLTDKELRDLAQQQAMRAGAASDED